jgi:hypothetical protein
MKFQQFKKYKTNVEYLLQKITKNKIIMKKVILFILTITILTSCTEVVDIPLETSNPKLVVEANINWPKGTSGNVQKIKLTKTTNFYSNSVPKVSGATVTVTNAANTNFNFVEIPNTGEYVCNNFIPVLNATYKMSITSEGKNYTATEVLKPVATIQGFNQDTNGGISGNKIRVQTLYNDPANTADYYLYKYKYPNELKPDFYVSDDQFYNGNPFFSVTLNDKLKAGDIIEVTHFGISQQYYNYLNILLSLTGNQGGGPFQSPPVSVRGNISNVADQTDFPFGYFSLSESDPRTYTIQ